MKTKLATTVPQCRHCLLNLFVSIFSKTVKALFALPREHRQSKHLKNLPQVSLYLLLEIPSTIRFEHQ
jgi:hypothetical protein